MPEYSFPLRSGYTLIERLESLPSDAVVRRWVLRDDNQQHYHGLIPLGDDPAIIELLWKPDTHSREQLVGVYRLDLAGLLGAGYIRREGDAPEAGSVRVRFHRGERGVVSLQVNSDGPALPIGTVDATLD